MSGTLATGLAIAEALSGFGQAGVTIGSVALYGFEVPERMPWGGMQEAVEHRLSGGGKVIDANGAFERPYRWQGVFSGPFASERALALDAIRQAGAPVALTWGEFVRTVLVVDFQCSTERGGFWCPYRIVCLDIPTVQGQAAQPTLLGQIANDIGDAIGVPNLVDQADAVLSQAGQAVSAVQTILPAAGSLIGGSAAFQAVAGAVGTAQVALSAGLGVANSAMGAIQAGPGILGGSGPDAGIAALNGAVATSGQLAGLSGMAGMVSRAAANLGVTL